MAVFVIVLEGHAVLDALPIVATEDPRVVRAARRADRTCPASLDDRESFTNCDNATTAEPCPCGGGGCVGESSRRTPSSERAEDQRDLAEALARVTQRTARNGQPPARAAALGTTPYEGRLEPHLWASEHRTLPALFARDRHDGAVDERPLSPSPVCGTTWIGNFG